MLCIPPRRGSRTATKGSQEFTWHTSSWPLALLSRQRRLMTRPSCSLVSSWALPLLCGNDVPFLLNEMVYPTHRGILNSLFMSDWYVGGTVAARVVCSRCTYDSSWSWRLPSVLQVVVPLIALPGFLLAPESPGWLVSVDRKKHTSSLSNTMLPVMHLRHWCTTNSRRLFPPFSRRRTQTTTAVTRKW